MKDYGRRLHVMSLDIHWVQHNDSGSASIMRTYTKDYYNYDGLLPRYKVPKTADIDAINAKY